MMKEHENGKRKSIRERKAYPYDELTNGSAVSDETLTNIVKLTYLSIFTA